MDSNTLLHHFEFRVYDLKAVPFKNEGVKSKVHKVRVGGGVVKILKIN